MTTSPAWWSRPPSSATALPPWVRPRLKALCAAPCAPAAVAPKEGHAPGKGKGVTVTREAGKLVIALHIKVGFGLNISTITQSITHRVKDEVELATGLKVARIDVYVDDVIAD